MKNKWFLGLVVVGALVAVYIWRTDSKKEPGPLPSISATPLADDMVILLDPLPGDHVSSPFVVRGRARGTWYFEATFPVELTDASGKVLAQVPAQAQSDWMTPDFVDFKATLTFTQPPSGQRGFLILKKDNPSGLPEHEDSRQITVYFK